MPRSRYYRQGERWSMKLRMYRQIGERFLLLVMENISPDTGISRGRKRPYLKMQSAGIGFMCYKYKPSVFESEMHPSHKLKFMLRVYFALPGADAGNGNKFVNRQPKLSTHNGSYYAAEKRRECLSQETHLYKCQNCRM